MGFVKGLGDAAKGLLKTAIAVVGLFILLGLLVGWSQRNKPQAQATMDKVMTAGASSIGWAADGITGMTGGQAAHESGQAAVPQTIWVESTAPKGWGVARAIKVWNKGLTGVQLKAGPCQPGARLCIKVSQGDVDTPPGESLVIGKQTENWFTGTQYVTFNQAAPGHVPARDIVFTSCHELGHALGLRHSGSQASCMFPSAKGSALAPSADDYAAVNAKYGH